MVNPPNRHVFAIPGFRNAIYLVVEVIYLGIGGLTAVVNGIYLGVGGLTAVGNVIYPEVGGLTGVVNAIYLGVDQVSDRVTHIPVPMERPPPVDLRFFRCKNCCLQ